MIKKPDRELLTPHRISMALFIIRYDNFYPKLLKSDEDESLLFAKSGSKCTSKERRATCMLISKLLLGNEMPLHDLLELVEASAVSPEQQFTFKEALHEMYDNGIEVYLSLFDTLEKFSMPDQTQQNTYPCPLISLVGLQLRQMNLAIKKFDFSQVVAIYQEFQKYYEACYKEFPELLGQGGNTFQEDESNIRGNVMEDSDVMMEQCNSDVSLSDKDMLECSNSFQSTKDKILTSDTPPIMKIGSSSLHVQTRQQAEIFIRDQISLLLMQDPKAVSPKELNNILSGMMKNCPDLGKGNFLTYLNCLRVREYAGALHSLVKAYDDANLVQQTDILSKEDITKSFRYASLSMASLHSYFNNSELALMSLKESITLAQECNDHICLQYALPLLYSLSPNQVSLMKKSYIRSGDMDLGYLSWLGLLNFTVQLSYTQKSPSELLKKLLGTGFPVSSRKLLDGAVQGQAGVWSVQGAMWSTWGNLPLAAICSQLVLHMNCKSIFPSQFHSPSIVNPTCASVCNVALALANLGEFNSANKILAHAQKQFPLPWEHAKLWMFSKAYINFYKFAFEGQWTDAKAFATAMATTHPFHSKFLHSQLLSWRGEHSQALKAIHSLKNESAIYNVPDLRVKCWIVEAESLAGGNNYGSALSILVKAISYAQLHHLATLTALASFHLAAVQMQLGLLVEAQISIEKGVDVIQSNGGVYDQARAKVLQAKLQVKSTKGIKRKGAVISATEKLSEAQTLFNRIDAYPRLKECLYLKARLFHEAGLYEERNESAYEYRQLEVQQPGLAVVFNPGAF